MAKVEKVGTPKATASPRPCAFVSSDMGNAPKVAPSRTVVEKPQQADVTVTK